MLKLFHEKFQTPKESTPEELTSFVRELLRDKFVNADIGVTGANFLIADTGSVCVTENEGNAMLSMAFPKIHIAIAGIEKNYTIPGRFTFILATTCFSWYRTKYYCIQFYCFRSATRK